MTNQAERSSPQPPPAWIQSAANWLTPRRIRAHAIVLAVCLWGVCAVDYTTPGLFDRAGNIKFQDFMPSYISAQLIAQDRTSELYNQQSTTDAMQAVIHHSHLHPNGNHAPTRVRLPNLYGPQVGLFFVPLARLSFPVAARIWVMAGLLLYFACVYLVWKSCPALRSHCGMVTLCAIAFPPLFHVFVRAQMSALVLACFTAAFLAFRADRNWLAGIALGFLIFKPQFLLAIPLVLVLSGAWKALAGLIVAAGAQLAFARVYFGPAVMQAYFDTLRHLSGVISAAELSLAPIQMHSLRSFWTLLIAFPPASLPQLALALYVLSSLVVVAMATALWKSSSPLVLRFSALTLTAVLVNPHLFVYDLLVLAPVLLLLADWAVNNPQDPSRPVLHILLYLAFVLPLFGPLSRWTHVQLSVPVLALLLWLLWRHSTGSARTQPATSSATPSHKLASNESAVV
jgi:alpha-1,2-mannosyltransferase